MDAIKEIYGNTWTSLDAMEIYNNRWVSIEIYGNPWNSMEIKETRGNPWDSMDSMEIYGNLWRFILLKKSDTTNGQRPRLTTTEMKSSELLKPKVQKHKIFKPDKANKRLIRIKKLIE